MGWGPPACGQAQGGHFHVQAQPRRRAPGAAPMTPLAAGWRTQICRPECQPRWPMAPSCSWRARPGRRRRPGLRHFYCCTGCGKVFWEGSHLAESPAASERSWRPPPSQRPLLRRGRRLGKHGRRCTAGGRGSSSGLRSPLPRARPAPRSLSAGPSGPQTCWSSVGGRWGFPTAL